MDILGNSQFFEHGNDFSISLGNWDTPWKFEAQISGQIFSNFSQSKLLLPTKNVISLLICNGIKWKQYVGIQC